LVPTSSSIGPAFMNVEAFVDTNVLLYAASAAQRYPAKHAKAWHILKTVELAISAQVLAEFYVNAQKSKPHQIPLSRLETARWIDQLCQFTVVAVDQDVVQNAIRDSQRYQISYWDAALIAAAEVVAAPILYTEDLNHGQFYGSVQVINPFLPTPQ
jgi:predicted nucleic acid-binding protein